MKVALIHPRLYVKAYDFFPLGLGYIASALEQKSIATSFHDLHKDWMKTSDLVKKISNEEAPDLFALSAMITSLTQTAEICRALKRHFPHSKIVLGGRISVLDPAFIFRHIRTDYIIKGEGEVAIIELIEMLEGKRAPHQVQGLAFRDEAGEIRSNGEAARITDVSDYPIYYRSFDIARYISRRTVQSPNLPSLNMLSARGCPYACTFCNFSKENNHRLRAYGLGLLEEAWDYLREHHGLRHVTFNDDIFTVNPQRLRDVCQSLRDRRLAFSCSTRLDCLDEDMITLLEESGCRYLCLGIESPAAAVAEIIDKKLDLGKCQRNIDLLKKTRMTVNFGFMIGHAGETEETIRETRDFVLKNRVIYSAFFATAFPETKLYDLVRSRIPDEEEYLLKLSTVDLSADYPVNMTAIPKSKLYRLRDGLVADSVLNVLKVRNPAVQYLLHGCFVAYLVFMRRFGLKRAVFKRIFEFLNIVVVKPLISSSE